MNQVEEYESQLADVQALLQASPDDESLLSLQKDLLKLISLTKASLPEEEGICNANEEPETMTAAPLEQEANHEPPPVAIDAQQTAAAATSSTATEPTI